MSTSPSEAASSADPVAHYTARLHALRALIAAEHSAAVAGNAPRLAELASEKAAALRQLAGLTSARLPAADRAAVAELIRDCMYGNRLNGTLVNMHEARTRALLQPLLESPGQQAYGPRNNGPARLAARVRAYA